jgi:Zn-dependent peptidase ImmA (M78 family)
VTFRLPRSLKVGARTIAVLSCKRSTRLADADGEYDPASGVIRVRAGLVAERRLQVLLHEVVHAVADDRLIDLSEDETEALALGLAALIVDNGLLD